MSANIQGTVGKLDFSSLLCLAFLVIRESVACLSPSTSVCHRVGKYNSRPHRLQCRRFCSLLEVGGHSRTVSSSFLPRGACKQGSEDSIVPSREIQGTTDFLKSPRVTRIGVIGFQVRLLPHFPVSSMIQWLQLIPIFVQSFFSGIKAVR